MKLFDFLHKNVVIVDSKGTQHIGYVYFFTQALDNEENEASIGLLPNRNSNSGIAFFESDIVSIKAID